jgi:hypothetical protein
VLFCTSLGCAADPCGTEILAEAASQDAQIKAVLFLRNCGATTGYVTAVSLVSPDESLGDDRQFFRPARLGNVFRAEQAGDVVIRWQSPRELLISYSLDAKVHLQERSRGAISISYRAIRARND